MTTTDWLFEKVSIDLSSLTISETSGEGVNLKAQIGKKREPAAALNF